jgi:DNA polymerase III subunit delta
MRRHSWRPRARGPRPGVRAARRLLLTLVGLGLIITLALLVFRPFWQPRTRLVFLTGSEFRGPIDGQVLDAARMEALVADAARYDVFRLIDGALNGQPAQVSRMLAGLRAEGQAVFALMGMIVMELQRVAALARVQERGGNLAAEFKAQRVWDSKQAVYRRALQRHPASRWQRLVVEAGRVDRVAKGRVRAGEESADAWQVLERLLLTVAEPKAALLLAS